MFKYLRTLNSNSHHSTVEVFPLSDEENELDAVESGSIVNLFAGKICTNIISGRPLYLVVEQEKNSRNVKCIRILPGMVIEGTIYPTMNANLVTKGMLLDIYPEDSERGIYFHDDGEPRFEIIDESDK